MLLAARRLEQLPGETDVDNGDADEEDRDEVEVDKGDVVSCWPWLTTEFEAFAAAAAINCELAGLLMVATAAAATAATVATSIGCGV